MRRFAIAALMLGACKGPLKPGETRCYTTANQGYGSVTNCETGQAVPVETPAADQGPTWWCSRSADHEQMHCTKGVETCDAGRGDGWLACIPVHATTPTGSTSSNEPPTPAAREVRRWCTAPRDQSAEACFDTKVEFAKAQGGLFADDHAMWTDCRGR